MTPAHITKDQAHAEQNPDPQMTIRSARTVFGSAFDGKFQTDVAGINLAIDMAPSRRLGHRHGPSLKNSQKS